MDLEKRRSYRELNTILPLLKGKPLERAGRKAKGANARDIPTFPSESRYASQSARGREALEHHLGGFIVKKS